MLLCALWLEPMDEYQGGGSVKSLRSNAKNAINEFKISE
ncbi:hypothetical protein DJ66_0403 [Candidatus Liberibacter solanacearum]|uniref:Uncharacterized protein n=1 Tax=Candidatus Liberibacter solanacearum TaxID=556287 RepID=A0A0F4VJQ3_9HYPH|nr:hypothetical protein DJ66_0403 [Candidatus Liberibacter solanacearum]